MSTHVDPIPQGYHTVTPHLIVNNAAKAIEFYQKAFNAQVQKCCEGPDGKVMHAVLKIGNSLIMLCDAMPRAEECGMIAPEARGTPVMLSLYVTDVDKAFEQAIKSGAKIKMPVADMFWGDRYGQLVDPFGHHWSMATKKENLTDEQIQERAAQFTCPAIKK